jgi:hypothetical protein
MLFNLVPVSMRLKCLITYIKIKFNIRFTIIFISYRRRTCQSRADAYSGISYTRADTNSAHRSTDSRTDAYSATGATNANTDSAAQRAANTSTDTNTARANINTNSPTGTAHADAYPGTPRANTYINAHAGIAAESKKNCDENTDACSSYCSGWRLHFLSSKEVEDIVKTKAFSDQ